MGRTRLRFGATAVVAAVAALVLPGVAAAARPAVTTGGAGAVTITTATLTGTINPRGLATTYYFQYGTTTSYGSRTPSVRVRATGANVTAVADLTGLGPNTRYHFRLLATNRDGTTAGRDRTFTTPRQPLGLALNASPNPVRLNGSTSLAGQLSGTGNAGRPVQLQQNPFPFTAGFINLGNAQLTDPAGNFAFALLSVGQTTQYRVVVADRPSVVSPVVTVTVRLRVRTRVTRLVVRRGGRIRFSGSVRPESIATPVGIQKRNRRGRWVTVAGTVTRAGGPGYSVYGRTIRVPRGGRYRVFVGAAGSAFAPDVGRTIRIRTVR